MNPPLKPRNDSEGVLNVIVETPRGHRNKYAYDPKLGLFRLKMVLPAGASFPYDFGFIPGTVGQDGDPLDVLILMDEPSFTGCLVPCRLIGNLMAEQREKDGKIVRNDRLITVAQAAGTYVDVRTLDDLNQAHLREIEHFFMSYNQARGREFRILKRTTAEEAWKQIKAAEKAA